jgi:hypothetical protein
VVTDENFASEADRAEIEEALTGPKLWCGVFAGQLAKIELHAHTHPDLARETRDAISLRMREMVRELAVMAGAREPDQPLVGADGLGGEETSTETGPELHDSHAVGEDDETAEENRA